MSDGVLALCPLCELPRGRIHSIQFSGMPVSVCACICATQPMTVLPTGVRAIPMTENHDPGDEARP